MEPLHRKNWVHSPSTLFEIVSMATKNTAVGMNNNQFDRESENFRYPPCLHYGDQASSVYLSNHQILNLYILHKSMPENMRRDVSFQQYMHSTVCKDQYCCNCERYSFLASHFDHCKTANCSICGPVQRLCGTNKRRLEVQVRDGNIFYNGYSNDTNTGTLEDVHLSKRIKKENQKIDDKVYSLGGVSSLNLLSNHERLSRLEQLPKTPASSAEGSRITGMGNDDIMSSAENMVHKVDHSGKLCSGSMDVFYNDVRSGHCEKIIQVGFEANQTKLEGNCRTISPPPGNDSKLGFEETKIQGGTLADVFTAAQLKEHLMSFSSLNCEASNSDSQNTCQLCAKDKLVFGPPPLYCSACGNRIKRNLIYHSSQDEMGARLSICTNCVKGCRGPIIKFRGISVSKAKLKKEKNNEEKEDLWVQCDRCQCWQHRVCGLYNDNRDAEGKAEYLCPRCCLDTMQIGGPRTATFGAKNLPTTKLSDHLEQRLFRRLEQEREEMANCLGKNLEEVQVAEDLVIRVVACVDKRLKVNQEFLNIFHEEDYPAEFEYRSKVIFLFQKIEGVDVCLFGMCVQEYGSECRAPNKRCVYISYLDSVKYFRPERTSATGDSLRTFVYHEILVGYLDYCKKRGFTTCYLWSCPVVKGEDYIFYSHPETQKTPDQGKLRQWYISMLKKAARDGVVVNYTNLYDCFFVHTNTKITAARLPYFDGDFWSGAAEDVVRNIEKESGEGLQRRKLPSKRTLKAMGHDNPFTDATKDVLVMQKLGQTISHLKENLLIIRLHIACTHCHEVILSGSRWFCNHCKKVQLCSRCFNTYQHITCSHCNKNNLSEVLVNDVPLDTKDEDIVLETNFFETREAFLDNCQKDNYQFDTLLHAKYSSMMILYKLSLHSIQGFCETKQKELVAKPNVILDVLMHASRCESKACPNTICGQLRRLFHHSNFCKVRVCGGCKICKKVWLILSEHSKICRDSDCRVPRCIDIKNHRRAQQQASISCPS